MSSHVHKIVVNAPIKSVWRLTYSIDDWAPLIPGYIEHTVLNEKESIWIVKSDFGIIKKKFHVKLEIVDRKEPEQITFKVIGINEKFMGTGYIQAAQLTENKTSITGSLEMNAEGNFAKVLKPTLKKSLSALTEEQTMAVKEKIEEMSRNF